MATVTVGCKLPHGLHMDLNGKRVTLKGANSSAIAGGHGITENVDESFFTEWMSRNKELAFVKSGHIFSDVKVANVQAQANERKDEKTGFEGMDPDEMPANLTSETKKTSKGKK